MQVVVFGNVTLDVLCYPVEEVPRHHSISFEQSVVSPGGCGSNVAIGLCALGVPTALVACTGGDAAAGLLEQYWRRWNLDCQYVRRVDPATTGVSVGLVDRQMQPRFIHTSGANRFLTAEDLKIAELVDAGANFLHVAGYFVLPGVLDDRLGIALQQAREAGLFTSLDVVHSPRMEQPEPLWTCLPHLDVFMCNQREAAAITGREDFRAAASFLRERGARTVIVKLGQEGCWVDDEAWQEIVPGVPAQVTDTTGAGDAFAAGLLAALASGADLRAACQAGNRAGARIVGSFGTVTGWDV
ncbi:MAG: carbohydrate kinase family protein [Anaerolineales bacterium]|jgi:sugar/nucleoside kinase (ribokinase family)|nr:carbohydrate kinase family protein [Anaerolineales bacterium]